MRITTARNTTPFGTLPIGEVFTELHDPDIPYMSIECAGCEECTEINAVNLYSGETTYFRASEEVVPHPLSEFILR